MTELWLNFKDEKGEQKRVLVEGEKFLIGRTPDNNLQIPFSNLSRQHAQIQRFADVFVISDCGSSNGTTLNDENLEKPIALKNKDKVNLGEAVEIEIEIISDKEKAGEGDEPDGANSGGSSAAGNNGEEKSAASAAGASGTGQGNSGSSDKGSISFGFLILAPIFGVCFLLVIVGIILLAGGKKEPEIGYQHNNYNYSSSENDENIDSPTKEEKTTPEKSESPTPTATATPDGNTTPEGSNSPAPFTPTPEQTGETISTPKAPTDAEKINGASASFLRRIAQGDPSAFLTDGQIAIVSQKINQFKNSDALADNIKNARKNAAEIQRMAASKDIKPQFLVNLALTKLGNQRGDVVAAAGQVLDSLSDIIKTFGAEFANECLLIVAALSNNTKAESLQTAAGILGKEFPFDRVRSLWFFKDHGKLSNEQFDYAIKFLAIGTITQNPKSFGVQADELKL